MLQHAKLVFSITGARYLSRWKKELVMRVRMMILIMLKSENF